MPFISLSLRIEFHRSVQQHWQRMPSPPPPLSLSEGARRG
jgi:hypothetical protein